MQSFGCRCGGGIRRRLRRNAPSRGTSVKRMMLGLVNTAVLNDPYAMRKKLADTTVRAASPRRTKSEEKSIFESSGVHQHRIKAGCAPVGRAVRRCARSAWAEATQVGLLAEIERMTAQSAGQAPMLQDLAKKLAIQISAVTHALRPLVRSGFVELQPDEHDKRAKRGALTTAGEARLREALVLWASANQRVEDLLGSESASALRTLADRVASDEFHAAYSRSQAEGARRPASSSKAARR